MVYLFHFATYFELNAGLRTPWPQYGTTSLQLNTYLEIPHPNVAITDAQNALTMFPKLFPCLFVRGLIY